MTKQAYDKIYGREHREQKTTNKWKSILKCKYGLSGDAYEALLEAQNFGCKICGATQSDAYHKRLAVDHDHKDGRIRGLLCARCNKILGFALDSTDILAKAIKYLKNEP